MAVYLAIGEVAERSGVAASALRFYERQGLIEATRTGGNQRRYDRAVLRRIAFIQAGRAAGVQLADIRRTLDRLPTRRTPSILAKTAWVIGISSALMRSCTLVILKFPPVAGLKLREAERYACKANASSSAPVQFTGADVCSDRA